MDETKDPIVKRAERAAKRSGRIREYSLRLGEKFDFYLVALTFTLLGLSVQTAPFTGGRFCDALELLGWVAFLVSGLVGLWRLETGQKYFELVAEYIDFTNLPEDRAALSAEMADLDRKRKNLYRLHRWAFVIGLVLVVTARGLPHLAEGDRVTRSSTPTVEKPAR